MKTPQWPFAFAFAGWCIVSVALKVGIGELSILQTYWFCYIFMFCIAFGLSTIGRIRTMCIFLLALSMTLATIGTMQSMNPLECIVLDMDEEGNVDKDASSGKSNGIQCETYHDCIKATNDYVSEFLCEKQGPFNTFSIGHGRVRWRGLLADPNELSLAIGGAMSFAFALHAASKKAWRHLVLLGAIAVATNCIVQTQSRGGVLVLLAVIGTYFVRRYGAKGAVVGAILGAPLLLMGGRSGEEAEASAAERTGALYMGMDFFKANPILGLGWGQFTENYFITAHNSYVLAAAELGFPGLLIWSCLLYTSIKIPYVIATRPFPTLDPRLPPYAFALVTSFAGTVVGIFFLSFTYHPILYIYFGLSAAMYLVARRSAPDFEVKVTGKEIGRIAAVDATLIVLVFIYSRLKGAP
jgi:hypothetical protein